MSNTNLTFKFSSSVTNINITAADESHRQETHTIRSVLAHSCPPLEYPLVPKNVAPFFTSNWESVVADDVSVWDDFNLPTLVDAFDDILQAPATLVQNPISFLVDGVPSLKNVQMAFLAPLLQSPVTEGSRLMATQLGLTNLSILPISLKNSLKVHFFESSFAIVLETRPDFTCLALGATRLAQTWSPYYLGQQYEAIWPFQHIATLAAHARTRYAFVFTDEEVVVCRVSDSERHPGNFSVEWRAVPLSASGTDNLTVALALWSLAMMGLNEDHRGIVSKSSLQPLNGWKKLRGSDGQDFYQHAISKKRVKALPFGGREL